jgi:hypothetical protein
MGMADGQSSPELLRQLAARQGVEVSDEDVEAVRPFLDAILPELARIEAELELDEAP